MLSLGILVGSCADSSTTAHDPGVTVGVCRPTPESNPMGRVGGNLAARGFPSEGVTAGHELKVLWFVRMPHEGIGLRLAIERLDGPGTRHVTNLDRAGPSAVPMPSGWEGSAAYPSNLTFDGPGCWRIRDIDGSQSDAVVVQVSSN